LFSLESHLRVPLNPSDETLRGGAKDGADIAEVVFAIKTYIGGGGQTLDYCQHLLINQIVPLT